MRRYRLWDGALEADLDLPELTPAPSNTAVLLEVRLERGLIEGDREWIGGRSAGSVTGPDLLVARVDGSILLRIPGRVDARLDQGLRRLAVDPAPGIDLGLLRHVIVDLLVPMCLAVRGKLILHASAVAAAGRAMALLGGSGMGKSTLATGLALRGGWSLVCDDALLVQVSSGGVVAVPSYPGVRLWGAPRHHLLPGVVGQPIAAGSDKQRLAAGVAGLSFDPAPVPLGVAIVLADVADAGAPPSLVRLSPRDLLLEMAAVRFRLPRRGSKWVLGMLDDIAPVATVVPGFRLHLPDDLQQLDAAVTLCSGLVHDADFAAP